MSEVTQLILFIVCAILYLIAMFALGNYLRKLGHYQKLRTNIIFFVIYTIILLMPGFSVIFFIVRPDSDLLSNLSLTGFIVAGFFAYFVLVLLGTFLFRLIVRLINKDTKEKMNSLFIKRIMTLASILVALLIIISGYEKAINPRTVTKDISNLGYKIVLVSDVHYGTVGSVVDLNKMVKTINKANPDLVLFLGDIIDCPIESIDFDYFNGALSNINSTYGIYGVTGNHEFYDNGYYQVKNFFDRTPIKLLFNEYVIINNSFRLVGRLDYIYGGLSKTRTKLEEICDKDSSYPTIVMDHQPQDFREAIDFNAFLQVSGHTHNGQMFPGDLIIGIGSAIGYKCPIYGLTKYNDFSLMITGGYGNWGFPFRTTSASEVVVLNI